MRCNASDDCYFFFQECVDHWSGGVCAGACEVANWFKRVVIFACASAAIAAYFCFRCNAERVSNFVAGVQSAGRSRSSATGAGRGGLRSGLHVGKYACSR